ncbi:MAG TPA: transcriptional coactivator p15/PC4 family protein [Polyangiaceae bacterium]|nr:transcriptional coactivator p15/PC4 family protein [Polyangiaceae bacterium]
MSETDEVLIAKIDRKEGERIHVAIRTYQGTRYIDARIHFRTDDGSAAPTKKGLTLNARTAAELASALDRAIAVLEGGAPPEAEKLPF